jgi:hypothetical protein
MTDITVNLSYRNPETDALESNPITPPPVGEWQFAKAQSFGAKIPLYAEYPRPTAEVNAFACHLWAHSTMPYVLKPTALFGAWPHKWSITTGPTGSTIGGELERTEVDGLVSHTVGESYQRYEWAGAKTGTHAIALKCEDQFLASVTYSHSATVDDSKFFFVDQAAANDSGDGTIGSPKKLFSSAWVAGNAGKIIVLRTGHYECTETGDPVNIGFDKATRPIAIINYPGEAVTASGSFWRDGGIDGTADDLLVRGITFVGYQGADNTHVFLFNGAQKRVTFEDCYFDDIVNGAVGDNNQACIAFLDGGAAHEHISVIDCSYSDTCKISLFIIFHVNYCLFERGTCIGATIPSSNGAGFYNIKDQATNVCVRGDKFIGDIAGAAPCLISNQNAPGVNIEHCWYTLVTNGDLAVYWNQQSASPGGSAQFDYAFTVKSIDSYAMRFAKFAPADFDVETEGGFVYGEYGPYDTGGGGTGYVDGTVVNQVATAAQIDSATGLMISTGTAFRLTHGAEKWSEIA